MGHAQRTPLLVRRGGCGIKAISAKPTLAPQPRWSLTPKRGLEATTLFLMAVPYRACAGSARQPLLKRRLRNIYLMSCPPLLAKEGNFLLDNLPSAAAENNRPIRTKPSRQIGFAEKFRRSTQWSPR